MIRYFNDSFDPKYKTTIGSDFKSNDIIIDNKNVSMQIWDTAGGEKHLSFQNIFYRHADACVLVFDLTKVETFDGLQGWKDELLSKGEIPNPTTFPFIILGNKNDLVAERTV